MDRVDFSRVEEVILVVDGSHLSFQNPKSFPEVGKRLASLGVAPRKPKVISMDRRPVPSDEDEASGSEDLYEEEEPPRRVAKAKKGKAKSVTHVPGGKSKLNLKVSIPSGDIKAEAARLKAEARASSKEMFQD